MAPTSEAHAISYSPTDINYFIHNMVVTAKAYSEQRITQEQVAIILNGELNMDSIKAALVRMDSVTVLYFDKTRKKKNDKGYNTIVATAGSSFAHNRRTIMKMHAKLLPFFPTLRVWDMRIENIHCTCYLPHPVNKERLSARYPYAVTNEPSFPGARVKVPIFRSVKKIKLLVFQSGKVVCIGAKQELDMIKALRWLLSIIPPFYEVISHPAQETTDRETARPLLSRTHSLKGTAASDKDIFAQVMRGEM